jgi:hypothetical protein
MEKATVSHKMPAGIKRVQKGVYRSLDDRYEVRDLGGKATQRWALYLLEGDQVLERGTFASRGDAVKSLADAGLLPSEAPKADSARPAPEAKPRPTRRQPKVKATASA